METETEKVIPRYEDTDPNIQVRTDLWGEMAAPQLVHQRELLMTRMDALHKMAGPAGSPSLMAMYNAMQMGLADINQLIDKRSDTKKKR